MKKHIYTEAEKTEITRLYPHCSTKEIARRRYLMIDAY